MSDQSAHPTKSVRKTPSTGTTRAKTTTRVGTATSATTRNERNSTAVIANGKRPRAGFRTTKYWLQKAVPEQRWHKRQVREAHLADELTRPDSSEVGRDIAAGGATETDNDEHTIGHETGPAEGRVAHIFRRRVTQPEPRNAVAEPASDETALPTMGGGSGSVCRDEQFDALSDLDSNSSSDGSEASLAPDAGKAFPGGTGARPLRKLKLTWRPRASRTPLRTGSNCTASSCAIEGCGRLPRIRYTDRRTKAVTDVCCLDCCYNVRDEEDVKVHTAECDTLQRKHDDEVDAALEPAPGAHRENDITAAMWSPAVVVDNPSRFLPPMAEPPSHGYGAVYHVQLPHRDGRRCHAHGGR